MYWVRKEDENEERRWIREADLKGKGRRREAQRRGKSRRGGRGEEGEGNKEGEEDLERKMRWKGRKG